MANFELPLKLLSREPGRHVWLLPYVDRPFDVPVAHPDRLAAWRHVATTVANRLTKAGRPELMIELSRLNYEGTKKISVNGAAWMPSPGLGIWPQGRAPHFLTTDDVYAMDPQKPYEAPFHPTLRVGEPAGLQSCWDKLIGYSGLVALFQQMSLPQYVAKSREVFLPMMTEAAFHAYPEYVPLLDSKVAEADPASIREWLCGAVAYLRDSPQDGGLLVVSLEPVDAIFTDLKFAPTTQPGWYQAPLTGLKSPLTLDYQPPPAGPRASLLD